MHIEDEADRLIDPFTLTPRQLGQLVDPKDPEGLLRLGGCEGLASHLHSSLEYGLPTRKSPPHRTQTGVSRISSILSSKIIDPSSTTPTSTVDPGTQEDGYYGARVSLYGRNALPPRPIKSILQLMWMALKEKIIILLMIAAAVSLGLGIYEDTRTIYHRDPDTGEMVQESKVNWVEGCAILVAVIIVILVGSINDYQKEKQFQKLNAKKEAREVKILRDGQWAQIPIEDVLVGDIMSLEPGEIAAADAVLTQGHGVQCDESGVTGESDVVLKEPPPPPSSQEEGNPPGLPSHSPPSRKGSSIRITSSAPLPAPSPPIISAMEHAPPDPFILSGSRVLEGVGQCMIIAVGKNSIHGRTMLSLQDDPEETPLQAKLNVLAEKIAKLGSAAALLMLLVLLIIYFASWGSRDHGDAATVVSRVVNIVISAVTIVVVAVPEGLPLAVTLALAFATSRMVREKNLVRVLAACETMGNATTICSDKTGTLTQNRMTVVAGRVYSQDFGYGSKEEEEEEEEEDVAQVPIEQEQIQVQDQGPTTTAPSPVKIMVESETSTPRLTLPTHLKEILFEGAAVNGTAFRDAQTGFMTGSKTEVALMEWIESMGSGDCGEIRSSKTILHMFPFSSTKKRMASIVLLPPSSPSKAPGSEGGSRSKRRVHVKGAAEIILDLCTTTMKVTGQPGASDHAYQKMDLTTTKKEELLKLIDSYARQALRTIALAYREVEGDDDDDDHHHHHPVDEEDGEDEEEKWVKDLTLVAILGIADPLREGVPKAVEACQRAGVKVRMVTGDSRVTAEAIARRCGILPPHPLSSNSNLNGNFMVQDGPGSILEGPQFRSLTPERQREAASSLSVLARSSPEDKRILVMRLKELGDCVAVTGDGTNDGPALKTANIGFAMGIAGTEVAKEAASIILMDDNFASLVRAISWGRCVGDAVRKFLQFQLTVNITAVVLTFVSAIVDTNDQVPVLTAVQLLWVNLIMDTLAALALATDPPAPELLDRPPDPFTAPLISPQMWAMILAQAAYQLIVSFILLYVSQDIPGVNLTRSQLYTLTFNTFVWAQLFNEINCRRIDNRRINVLAGIHKNPWFISVLLITALLQVIIVQWGGHAFQTVPLPGSAWGVSIALGFLSLPVGVIVRLIPADFITACWPSSSASKAKAGKTLPLYGSGAGMAGGGAARRRKRW
ncbi:MAG: PMCA-type calcium-translocating P-type ATPase [Piptocephalis tieghemiana]|nr:MAG: PMCA-type calcium-translocating P-type ATPase [Piptocephalis tieghemiana]